MSTTRSISATSSSTSGNCATNFGHSGARCRMPKLSGALMRSRPRGFIAEAEAIASTSAISSTIDRARSYSASPLSVSDILRELRLSRRVPRCSSRSAMMRVTFAGEVSSASAARAKPFLRTTSTNTSNARKRSMRRLINSSKLNIASAYRALIPGLINPIVDSWVSTASLPPRSQP